MLEIERKFHLKRVPDGLQSERLVVQGYILRGSYSIRLRRVDQNGSRYYITQKTGEGLVRKEIEKEIDPELFELLWPLVGEMQVHKIRYELEGWEIDEYLRCGKVTEMRLVTAEIELDSEEEEINPPAPIAREIIDEVTGQALFVNQVLAQAETLKDLPYNGLTCLRTY